MVVRLAERDIATKFGVFSEILFYDGISESIALTMGDLRNGEEVLCRIHSACIGGHVFNSTECECASEIASAQAAIEEARRGLIIYLDQEGKGNGHLALLKSIPFKKAGHSQGEAYELAGYKADARSFQPAAKIIKELGIRSIILMTENSGKAAELREMSISVSGTRKL